MQRIVLRFAAGGNVLDQWRGLQARLAQNPRGQRVGNASGAAENLMCRAPGDGINGIAKALQRVFIGQVNAGHHRHTDGDAKQRKQRFQRPPPQMPEIEESEEFEQENRICL